MAINSKNLFSAWQPNLRAEASARHNLKEVEGGFVGKGPKSVQVATSSMGCFETMRESKSMSMVKMLEPSKYSFIKRVSFL